MRADPEDEGRAPANRRAGGAGAGPVRRGGRGRRTHPGRNPGSAGPARLDRARRGGLMAPVALVNATIWVGGHDFSSDSNKLMLSAESEALDATTFGSAGWKENRGGLKQVA